jgi:hypothetical protein
VTKATGRDRTEHLRLLTSSTFHNAKQATMLLVLPRRDDAQQIDSTGSLAHPTGAYRAHATPVNRCSVSFKRMLRMQTWRHYLTRISSGLPERASVCAQITIQSIIVVECSLCQQITFGHTVGHGRNAELFWQLCVAQTNGQRSSPSGLSRNYVRRVFDCSMQPAIAARDCSNIGPYLRFLRIASRRTMSRASSSYI